MIVEFLLTLQKTNEREDNHEEDEHHDVIYVEKAGKPEKYIDLVKK